MGPTTVPEWAQHGPRMKPIWIQNGPYWIHYGPKFGTTLWSDLSDRILALWVPPQKQIEIGRVNLQNFNFILQQLKLSRVVKFDSKLTCIYIYMYTHTYIYIYRYICIYADLFFSTWATMGHHGTLLPLDNALGPPWDPIWVPNGTRYT
jgi:hypothetical protein